MPLIAQPFRHPDSGIYYLRRAVPEDIRAVIGRGEIRRSLRTRDHRQAKASFAIAYAESEQLFNQARQSRLSAVTAVKSDDVGEALIPSLSSPEKHLEPLAAPVLTTPHPSAPLAPRLSQLFQRYAASLPLTNKPEHVQRRHLVDYGRAIDLFVRATGDLRLNDITPVDIQNFAAQLVSTSAKGQDKPLATSTVRLILARLSSVFSYAVDSGLLTLNPVSSSRIHKRLGNPNAKRRLDNNRGYELSEMVSIFSHPEFAKQRTATGRPGHAMFWIPLIAAYTGARREEIAQLYVSDVRQSPSGHWFFRIDDDRPDKSIKTESSRRDIPLHEDLIELGLLQLTQDKDPNTRVFPELLKLIDGYAGIISKTWQQMTKQWGLYRQGRSPLHGFRHSFKTLAREVGIPKEVSDWITGHAANGVGDSYGVNPISRMSEEMRKLPSIAKLAGLLPKD